MRIASNIQTFLDVACDSQAESERISRRQRRPKPGGAVGEIITYDPEHRSFKHALISIAFAGIYLDALLRIEGWKIIGADKFKKIEYRNYEDKLRALGVRDQDILSSCRRFRMARNEVMHEKPLNLLSSAGKAELLTAQHEARHAIEFIRRLRDLFAERSK